MLNTLKLTNHIDSYKFTHHLVKQQLTAHIREGSSLDKAVDQSGEALDCHRLLGEVAARVRSGSSLDNAYGAKEVSLSSPA